MASKGLQIIVGFCLGILLVIALSTFVFVVIELTVDDWDHMDDEHEHHHGHGHDHGSTTEQSPHYQSINKVCFDKGSKN